MGNNISAPVIKESMKADYIKNVKDKIERFSKFLGDNPWFTGKNVSIITRAHQNLFFMG